MVTLQGKGVYRDICIGRLVYYGGNRETPRLVVEDCQAQLQRYEAAIQTARRQLADLYERSIRTVGEANAAIFQVQELLLTDEKFSGAVRKMIREESVNAEYAVQEAGKRIAGELEAVEDAYVRERAGDVQDVAGRLLAALSGSARLPERRGEPFILAAEDLLPSQAAQLSEGVLGFALSRGSTHSHTAVLARSMGLPSVMKLGPGLGPECSGKLAVVDGFTGTLYIDPDEATLSAMEEKKRESERHREMLQKLKGKKDITRTGKRIRLYANAGSLADVDAAVANDAGGIGLLRSEILYLDSESAPDEESQFSFYRQALERMGGREVVIRTFDIGADKRVPWLAAKREENPALGMRAVRLGLERPELLKTQLRALYRAGLYGKLSVLYPMITSVEEVRSLRALEQQVRRELEQEGTRFADRVPTGIMIETPAAALLSDLLAKEVDFFSVGTNDLTQYALALDRQNDGLERFRDPKHRAVLRLVEMAAENAHAAGIRIGICGELAADTDFTQRFLQMGIDELSVPPGMILEVRRRIREI